MSSLGRRRLSRWRCCRSPWFAVRYGCGLWGAGAGFVFGTVTYLIGNKFSIDWTTIICDYFLAFTALGFGAGLVARRKWSVFYGTVIGGLLRFGALCGGRHRLGEYMPETFFGMTMHSPWFYSLLYNLAYMLPNIILCLLVFAVAYKPLKKYFTAEDLKLAQ